MANPPNIAVVLSGLKCFEQEDTELPIVDNEDDEPYVVVLSLDVGSRMLAGLIGSVSPPAFQLFRIGPMENIDKDDLKPAPANQLWDLDGNPAPIAQSGTDVVHGVAVGERQRQPGPSSQPSTDYPPRNSPWSMEQRQQPHGS